jgi:hypothetical protein
MKKLLAGLAVLLTASFTACFAVHGFNGAMSVLSHGAA